jgi:phage terminase small subunit
MPVIVNPRFELVAQGLAAGKTQAKAFVDAGYSKTGSRGAATRLLHTHPEIKLRVTELLANRAQMLATANVIATEKLACTIANILKESACIAFSDPAKLFKEDGSLKHITEMDEDTRGSIASIEVVDNFKMIGGKPVLLVDPDERSYLKKVKFWDKNAAHEKLMKYLGLFIERVEHGKPGEFAHMTEAELEQFVRNRMERIGDGGGRDGTPPKPEGPDTVH